MMYSERVIENETLAAIVAKAHCRVTAGGDKGYDNEAFVTAARYEWVPSIEADDDAR